MVRPARLCFNLETASSNAFQKHLDSSGVQQRALVEFDRMVEQLRAYEIHVDVLDDTPLPVKPDAVFPNNWFSTHDDGTIVLYPMLAENRRLERRHDLIDTLAELYQVNAVVDLSVNERRERFLEGTGSMVLDRMHRIAYAVRSPRTHETIVESFAQWMEYQQPAMVFDSVDESGKSIYHTNVMMAIGTRVAVICLKSIPDDEQRQRIVRSLEVDGQRTVVSITLEQMKHFAGNMLEVQNRHGERFLAMSKQAFESLDEQQRLAIEATDTTLISFDIATIEQCGGGSVRCMIAENFLPQNREP